MRFKADEIASVLQKEIEQFQDRIDAKEVGRVLEVGDGIARVYGLTGVMAGEMVDFPRAGIKGLAFNLEENSVGVIILGKYLDIKEGDEVRTTGALLRVPVGDALIGRVVDPLGVPKDGKGPIITNLTRAVESNAPGVADRQPVDEPMQTGIKAIDAYTLRVDLKHPAPYFLELTAFCTFFPYKELESSIPLYSGPYRLKDYKTKDHIHLEKNPTYWGTEKVKLEQIQIFLVDDSVTALEMFERGEIDILGPPFTTLPPDSLPMIKKQYELESLDTAGTVFLCFNNLSKYFKNEKLRQAFLLSIDRKDLVENLTFLNETVATSLLPPMLQKGKESQYVWITDRKKARELFKEALEELQLSKEDLKIRFTYSPYSVDGVFSQIGQAIQEQLRVSLDIHIQMEQLEHKVYLDRLHKRDFDISGSFILAQYLDPLAYLERFKCKTNLRNYPAFEDPLYSSLLERANQTYSSKEREKLLAQAEKILIESANLFPLYHCRNGYVVSKKIKNLKSFPSGWLFLEEVEIL